MACSNYTDAPVPFSAAALIHAIEKLNATCPDDLVGGIGVKDSVADGIFTGIFSFFDQSLGPWSPYAAALILSRLIDFKLPLLQLISQLPRPKLISGRRIQAFAVLHLIGDPIDSMSGYLFTLATCMVVLKRTKNMLVEMDRERAAAEADCIGAREVEEGVDLEQQQRSMEAVQMIPNARLPEEVDDRVERRCKLITLVYLSYASNGHEKDIETLIRCEAAHPPAFEAAALAIAADRGSNFWAVGVAIFGFSTAVVLKYRYIDRETFDVANPQHIDIWSLSSSMTMVHIIPNVLLASIISVQSSPYTVRRFLAQFEARLRERVVGRAIGNMQTVWAETDPGQQINNGAIPNWRPDRQYPNLPLDSNALPILWRRLLDLLAFLIVTTASAGAIWLAAAVPPLGMNCRTVIKLIMVSLYVVKYAVQLLVNRLGAPSSPMKMSITAVMDASFTILFAFIIFSTQTGILNRPGCYRQCKADGECAVYPASASWELVRKGLRELYPAILFGFLGMQILVCILLLYGFGEARRVFLQDDTPIAIGEGEEGMDQRREYQDISLRPILRK